ncbi:tannase/feruloyl esterase family alpha/beta hydrolase [Hydrogenophaga sp. RWCD_12]|uniref:tannase/feruloyl esterase family alpha/beta hydrolase n=1 Tax=Hydrogenophaga sp. RWCD_12 TaxID=3391190 RepID=UPI0039852715
MRTPHALPSAACAVLIVMSGCATKEHSSRPGAATPAPLQKCTELATAFGFANARITGATLEPAGRLVNAGQPVGEHCRVTGRMNERTSPVDGQAYAIGFEMRLPTNWSGRFLYQGNGGTDGVVVAADGGNSLGSGGLLRNALQMGFAVISSDAGHSSAQNPLFGLDPQARRDYGHNAIGTLTPMAKALIRSAYGKGPDRSYIGGTSNGGRQALVAATLYPDAFDGVLAQSPGIHLPRASVANLSNVKRWDTVVTTREVNGQPDYESALPPAERELVARAVLARCDALDGLSDGLVNDVEACRTAFDPARDLPTCTGERDGRCLSAAQKIVLAAVHGPARNGAGEIIYSGFPFDPGIRHPGWAEWKFRSSLRTARNPVSVGFIFSSPPVADLAMATDTRKSAAFALAFDIDRDGSKIFTTSGVYTDKALDFMGTLEAPEFDRLRGRGGKVLVFHGTADPIFSSDHTQAWYRALDAHQQGRAAEFARLFLVPGQGHSRGGPATEQYDGLAALVDWVENGRAPERIVASARGAGNPGGANTDVPADWSPTRTRPLCPYPQLARYTAGDTESAASFACRR